MGSGRVMMPIADHPDILPDLALEHVAIVLHGHKKLGSEERLNHNILGGQTAIGRRMHDHHGRVALKK